MPDYADEFFHHLFSMIEHVGDANVYSFDGDDTKHKRAAAQVRKHARWLYRKCCGPMDEYARSKINEI